MLLSVGIAVTFLCFVPSFVLFPYPFLYHSIPTMLSSLSSPLILIPLLFPSSISSLLSFFAPFNFPFLA